MKRRFGVFALWLAAALLLQGATYTIGYQKTLPIPFPGATAAYAVNSDIAEASADQGVVTVLGKNPGNTHIVVVTLGGVETIEITVPLPPPKFPKGFVPPEDGGSSRETGYYETLYSSLPQQLINVVDFARQGEDLTTHFHLAATDFLPSATNPFGSASPSIFSLTSLSYSMQTSRRSVTLVDQYVNESPLTVGGATVRGLHWQEGDWFVHAGYTSPQSFENIFLPSQREGVYGMGYRLRLTPHSLLTPSVYYLTAPGYIQSARSGSISSLLYTYRPSDDFQVAAEIGYSMGVGGSFNLTRRRPGEYLRARFRYTPEDFAALSISNFHGILSDASWTRQWSPRFGSDFNYTGDRFNLPGFQELSMNGGVSLRYRPMEHWTVFGGATYSVFRTEAAGQSPLEGLYLPVGTSVNFRHLGTTLQYQRSRFTGQDTEGQESLVSTRAGFGPVSFSGYAERQTQAPTLGFLLSNVNSLGPLLTQYGVTATSPQQISDFLNQYASLINLQYLQNVTIHVTPVQEQVSGSLSVKTPAAYPQFDYQFLYNSNQTVSSSNELIIHRLTGTQRLGRSNDLSLTVARYTSKAPGQVTTNNPFVLVTMRHHFDTAPAFLVLERHGAIHGRVFDDADGQGEYTSAAPGVSGIEVVLDEKRRTRTGSDGSFRFAGVPEGKHQVHALLADGTPYYFTTPESAELPESGEANFGIARSLSSLGGEVRDDSNRGIAGIVVAIHGKERRLTAISGGDGKFLVPRLPDGEYSVSVEADALPAGYMIEPPAVAEVVTKAGGAARANFRIRALRNVAGRVLFYDAKLGQYVGVQGVVVTLQELSVHSTTASDGRYLFRELPAGTYVISAEFQGRTMNQIVKVPDDPAQIDNINLVIGQR